MSVYSMPITISARHCWVRWDEFIGKTPWYECSAVHVSEGWLMVVDIGGTTNDMLVPNHLVRGRVEITYDDPTGGSK